MAELEAPYRKALEAKKQAMLTAAERAVLAIPEKERTPIQKQMAAGLESSLKITWEEVAAAVPPNPADHADPRGPEARIHEIETDPPPPPRRAMALVDREAKAPDTFVLRRGDPKREGPAGRAPAPRRGPRLAAEGRLPGRDRRPARPPGRRAALARWLTRPDNPLTARVIVNRLWQHHFGRGIVATPSDFGVRGEPPRIPSCSTGWPRADLARLAAQADPPADGHLGHLPAGEQHRRTPTKAADDPDNSSSGR